MTSATDHPDDLVAAAQRAEQAGDWAQALARWREVRERVPDNPVGYVGVGEALQHLARFDEADAVLAPAAHRFVAHVRLAVEYARVAHRRGDWPEALRRWQDVATRFTDNADAASGVGTALQILGRLDAADAYLAAALSRFAEHAQVAVEYARVAHRRGDWPEALRRWQDAATCFADNADARAGVGTVLLLLDRHDEADAVLGPARAAFPTRADIWMEYARVAHRRRDWPEALRRWNMAAARFSEDPTIRDGRGEALVHVQASEIDRLARGGAPNAQADTQPEAASWQRDLMLHFESLGSGCEFGLVQRYFGAEPLGLLRWGAIPAMALVEALASRFDGLGDAGHVVLFELGDSKEYFFRDTQYRMEMHTFLPADPAQYEQIFAQQCRRVRYLRSKMLDDLALPPAEVKIFVYKQHVGRLPDTDAFALHAALRTHGPHWLLCVRPEDAAHPDGTLEMVGDGLLFGYIAGLSPTSDARVLNYRTWLNICRATAELRAAIIAG